MARLTLYRQHQNYLHDHNAQFTISTCNQQTPYSSNPSQSSAWLILQSLKLKTKPLLSYTMIAGSI
jgi:hypothetical protein